jgi:hypothetical protein
LRAILIAGATSISGAARSVRLGVRLAAIRKKYDPDNFYRLNQNIKPTAT